MCKVTSDYNFNENLLHFSISTEVMMRLFIFFCSNFYNNQKQKSLCCVGLRLYIYVFMLSCALN